MTETTNLVIANQSESLRTTIPVSFVRQFKLVAKDQIEWDMKVIDGKLIIIITPVKKNKT